MTPQESRQAFLATGPAARAEAKRKADAEAQERADAIAKAAAIKATEQRAAEIEKVRRAKRAAEVAEYNRAVRKRLGIREDGT